MEAEKPKKMDTSTSGNMTISGSMDKLVEEEEKKPQYRVTKISEVGTAQKGGSDGFVVFFKNACKSIYHGMVLWVCLNLYNGSKQLNPDVRSVFVSPKILRLKSPHPAL